VYFLRSAHPDQPSPVLKSVTVQQFSNNTTGFYSVPIRLYNVEAGQVIADIDADYIFGSGFSQAITSLSEITYFDGSEMVLQGGSKFLANHRFSNSDYTRYIGTVAQNETFTIPTPFMLSSAQYAILGFDISIIARSPAGNVVYSAIGYLEGTGGTSSNLRLTEFAGASYWEVTGDLYNKTLTVKNLLSQTASDCIVRFRYFGSPRYTY